MTNLASDLTDLFDCTVWFDRELNRSGGQEWWANILEQIRQCEVFLYALTPPVLKSEPCKREYGYARALGKPVLPVLLDEVIIRELPLELQRVQLVNFREASREQLRSMRESLRNLPPAPPLPDPLPKEPEVPHDPVSLLLDRIVRMTSDHDQQRLIILDIDELYENDVYAVHAQDLLDRLLQRDDVLTARNQKRARELLKKISRRAAQIEVFATAKSSTKRAYKPGEQIIDDKGVSMVYVPPTTYSKAWTFLMGSTRQQADAALEQFRSQNIILRLFAPKESYDIELPQHKIVISHAYWLDMLPVTNEMYEQFVKDDGYKNPLWWTKKGWQWVQKGNKIGPHNFGKEFNDPQQPRVGVTWYESDAYCRWRGGRLPTEAEWEWAARGPKGLTYTWGNQFNPDLVILHPSDRPSKVGIGIRSDGASWINALDMCGNVSEWCSSLFWKYPYDENDGRENLESDGYRILRGGSCTESSVDSRTTSRHINASTEPNDYSYYFGIRCVRDLS
ncbi:MAG: SUMF1/EgtB/PvdO family nonheme iron enzyme [Anaerolineae bacterium]|nr:SUMF1/EgtB/PvdO family nonheme iron enzyme [Anaerolineae bacterium]